jgi:hypothetical protein
LLQLDPPGPDSLILSQLPSNIGLLVIVYTALGVFVELATQTMRGADRYQLANLFGVMWNGVFGAGVVVGAYCGGYLSALWSGSLALVGVAVVVTAAAIRSWSFGLPTWRQAVRTAGSAGARGYLIMVMEIACESIGAFYLAYRSDLAGVAAFVGCQRMATLIGKPSSMIHVLLQGKVAGQRCGVAEARQSLQIARLMLVCAVLWSIPLLVGVRPFTRLTLGAAFDDAIGVMSVCLLAEILRAYLSAAAGVLVGQGCRWPYVLSTACRTAITVVATLVMCPFTGALGAAWAQCLGLVAAMAGTGAILAVQARSVRSVFLGGDLHLLTRLVRGLRSRSSSGRETPPLRSAA